MKAVEFPVPEGFKPPDNGGGPFDVVCTFQPTDDGKSLCMTKFADIDMPAPKEGDEDEEQETVVPRREYKPSYKPPTEQPAGAAPY